MIATDADLVENLTRFFVRSRALQPPPITLRLAQFFEDWRSLHGTRDTTCRPPLRELDSPRLKRMFEALGPALQNYRRSAPSFNLWAVSGIGADEVRISAVLAWFLNPAASHGAGNLFAKAFWDAAGGNKLGFTLDTLRRSATEVCPLANAADRVDIVLEGHDLLVFAEIKVYAGLQPVQLERYLAAVEQSAKLNGKSHAALIYLAPHPAKLPSGPCLWLSWRRLARTFRLAANQAVSPLVRQSALHFAQHVEGYRGS